MARKKDIFGWNWAHSIQFPGPFYIRLLKILIQLTSVILVLLFFNFAVIQLSSPAAKPIASVIPAAASTDHRASWSEISTSGKELIKKLGDEGNSWIWSRESQDINEINLFRTEFSENNHDNSNLILSGDFEPLCKAGLRRKRVNFIHVVNGISIIHPRSNADRRKVHLLDKYATFGWKVDSVEDIEVLDLVYGIPRDRIHHSNNVSSGGHTSFHGQKLDLDSFGIVWMETNRKSFAMECLSALDEIASIPARQTRVRDIVFVLNAVGPLSVPPDWLIEKAAFVLYLDTRYRTSPFFPFNQAIRKDQYFACTESSMSLAAIGNLSLRRMPDQVGEFLWLVKDLVMTAPHHEIEPVVVRNREIPFKLLWNNSRISLHNYAAVPIASALPIISSNPLGPFLYTAWAEYGAQVQIMLAPESSTPSARSTSSYRISLVRIRTGTFAIDLLESGSIEFEPYLAFSIKDYESVQLEEASVTVKLPSDPVFHFSFCIDRNSWDMTMTIGKTKNRSPLGLFGAHFMRSLFKYLDDDDPSGIIQLDWSNWYIERRLELPTELYAVNMISGGELSHNSMSVFDPRHSNEKLDFEFVIEGSMFDLQGFSHVNRYLWWHMMYLSHYPNVEDGRKRFWRVWLAPTDAVRIKTESSLLVREIFRSFLMQQEDESSNAERVVVFRNSWPPSFENPAHLPQYEKFKKIVYIHQQPWEFLAIPKSWTTALNPDELWIPSDYSAKAFRPHLDADKIRVIPHGVSVHKHVLHDSMYRGGHSQGLLLSEFLSAGYFVFLFSGGLLPRKGIDKLLDGYLRAFVNGEKVLLVIHSVYGDGFMEKRIRTLSSENETGPKVLYLTQDLDEAEKSLLYSSSHVYISPYRSEGYGLTLVEAICHNLPIIVSGYGPALEFPYPASVKDRVYFVEGEEVLCGVKPCGSDGQSVFGEPVAADSFTRWFEPNVSSLVCQIKRAYHETNLSSNKPMEAAQIVELDHAFGWKLPMKNMIDRIYALL